MPRKPTRSPLPVPDEALDQDITILGKKGRGKLWLKDGSCIRLRPEQPNHV